MLNNGRLKMNKVLLAVFLVVFCITSTVLGQAQASGVKLNIVPDPGVPDHIIKNIEKGGELFGAMFKTKYGLTLEKTIRMIMTADRKGYEAAHVRYRGITPQQATRLKSNGMSIKNNTILLNGASPAFETEATTVRLVGHELFHKMQVQLSRSKSSKHDYIWLREGAANLFGAGAAEFGGLMTFENYVEQQLEIIKKTGKVPAIERLTERRSWLKARAEGLNPYQNATVMIKYLSDNYGGPEKVLNYWVAYGKMDRETAFKQTFGITHEQFLSEFIVHFQKILGDKISVNLREAS